MEGKIVSINVASMAAVQIVDETNNKKTPKPHAFYQIAVICTRPPYVIGKAEENKAAHPGTKTPKSGQFSRRRRTMSNAAPGFSSISTTAKSTTDSSRSADRSPIIINTSVREMEQEVLQHNNASNNPDFEATCKYGGFKLLKWKLCVQVD